MRWSPVLSDRALDPQTPLLASDPIGMHFTGPNQTYVQLELAAHFVLVSSRYTADDFFSGCGLDLMEQFMTDPTAALDTSCASDPALLDFAGDVNLARMLFGSDTRYFGASGGPLVMNERMRRLREQARRAFQRARSGRLPAPTLP